MSSFGILLDRIRNALRSPRCLYCDAPQKQNSGASAFCNRCHERLGIRPANRLHGHSGFPCYAAMTLNSESKRLLYGYKFYNRQEREPVLAQLLIESWRRIAEQASPYQPIPPIHPETVLVLPVPAHEEKPSHVAGFARRFARHYGFDFEPRALVWQREVTPQHTLHDRQARLLNIAGGLSRREDFQSRHAHLIIVDDLTTTGATLRECVRALKDGIPQARHLRVTALTIAATPLSHTQRAD